MNRDLNEKVAQLREDYQMGALLETEVAENPFRQFESWFKAALGANLAEPNAMTLATVDEQGRPAARIVLLKGFDEKGLYFYTNYGSAKGQQLHLNPQAALVFAWIEMERQIRIDGLVEQLSTSASEQYFRSRPRDSQFGALVSAQSQVISDRSVLEDRLAQLKAKYPEGTEIPMPENWGGYLVRPYRFEFWQGRSSRLHDRLRYTIEKIEGEEKKWKLERLAP